MNNKLEERSSARCLCFNDGTKPICHAEGQLGHLCRPCGRQDQAARILFDNGTPQARRALLHRESQNLRVAGDVAHSSGCQNGRKGFTHQAPTLIRTKPTTINRNVMVPVTIIPIF